MFESLRSINFWWIEEGWRWRLVPEAEPPDYGAYFRQAFAVPFYGFSDGSLGAALEAVYSGDLGDHSTSQAVKRREQPIFNSLLFETIYAHSEVCLILPQPQCSLKEPLKSSLLKL